MTSENLEEYHDFIKSLLTDTTVGYHPNVARAMGGAKAGLMLLQLLYWSFNESAEARGGWFWKSVDEFEKETALTPEEQITARETLRKNNLIQCKRKGIPRRWWYWVDLDEVVKVVSHFQKTGATLKEARPEQARDGWGQYVRQAEKANLS